MSFSQEVAMKLCYLDFCCTLLIKKHYYMLQKIVNRASRGLRGLNNLNWYYVLGIVVIGLGIFFRFFNLDHKIYWGDEVFTSLWISGRAQADIITTLYSGQLLSHSDLQNFQTLQPGTNLVDTVRSLAKDASLITPLYHIFSRLWVVPFGDSIASVRALSAVLSVLALPCMYWLCIELFQSSTVAWTAVVISAVSPWNVLFAQEARLYSLAAATILLCSACLIRATRISSLGAWFWYSLTLALMFYSFFLSLFVAFGHGIYVYFTQKIQDGESRRTILLYTISSLFGFLLFSPWFLIIYLVKPGSQTPDEASVVPSSLSLVTVFVRLAGISSRVFFDAGLNSTDSISRIIQFTIPLLFTLVVIAYSFYFLFFGKTTTIWLFPVSLTVIVTLLHALIDVLKDYGWSFLTTPRYLVSLVLGIQISVAYLLASKIFSSYEKRTVGWKVILCILLSLSIASCLISSQARVWWNKGASITADDYKMSLIISQSKNSLVISDAMLWHTMSLHHMLPADTYLQLVGESLYPGKSQNFENIFSFRSSDKLLENFAQAGNY